MTFIAPVYRLPLWILVRSLWQYVTAIDTTQTIYHPSSHHFLFGSMGLQLWRCTEQHYIN